MKEQLKKTAGKSGLNQNTIESMSDSGYSRLLEFLVEKVLKRRIAENGANEYLIKWRTFSVKEATWHRNAMERIGTGYFLSDQRNILTIHPKLYDGRLFSMCYLYPIVLKGESTRRFNFNPV